MKKFLRSMKSIPYFCLALTIIFCSVMMAIPAAAAGPLGGADSSEFPYYSFDTVPSGFPTIHLPDLVSSAPSDCIITQYKSGSIYMTFLFVADSPGSMSVSLTENSFSISGKFYFVPYDTFADSWEDPIHYVTTPYSKDNLSEFRCVVTPSLLSSSLSNVIVSPVTYHTRPTGVLDVAGGVGSWLVGALGNAMQMFYADGALTFLGYLAVAGLAISLILLFVLIISRFIKFGG